MFAWHYITWCNLDQSLCLISKSPECLNIIHFMLNTYYESHMNHVTSYTQVTCLTVDDGRPGEGDEVYICFFFWMLQEGWSISLLRPHSKMPAKWRDGRAQYTAIIKKQKMKIPPIEYWITRKFLLLIFRRENYFKLNDNHFSLSLKIYDWCFKEFSQFRDIKFWGSKWHEKQPYVEYSSTDSTAEDGIRFAGW